MRPQPRFGTVEIRIMDGQTTLADNAAVTALVQCIVRRAVEEDGTLPPSSTPQEVLAENRFLAARDGMDAELIDPGLGERLPARDVLEELVAACRPHAQDLGCEAELEAALELSHRTGAQRQLERLRSLRSLPRLVAVLADDFTA